MSNIIAFINPWVTTNDHAYTLKDLENKIMKMCKTRCGTINGQAIGKSVINSFVNNGIVEIYNEVGHQEWIKLVNNMIDTEIKEGKYEQLRLRDTDIYRRFQENNIRR